jgi:hypothetical protein
MGDKVKITLTATIEQATAVKNALDMVVNSETYAAGMRHATEEEKEEAEKQIHLLSEFLGQF